jgi:transposase
VAYPSLNPGDPCPACLDGKVYRLPEPQTLVRVKGMAPLLATVYELDRLRCNLCGQIFTAKAPPGVGTDKYDESAAAMIGLLKYGCGLPFNRLERLERGLGIPLPASTQWDLVARAAEWLDPAYRELIRQAAQGEVLHNDDTTAKILELMGHTRQDQSSGQEDALDRTGLFTTGIVSAAEGRRIALFFSGRKHAGENLAEVLAQRATDLSPPIQMCDALSRNVSGDFQTIVGHCIAHARRNFVEVADYFPDECRLVLETLRDVYHHDALAREQKLTPEERLAFHQARSAPLMEALKRWLAEQFSERKVEPNSTLGNAIKYMRKHWDKLTLFLRQPGAPLDNNVVERSLKKAILHRKNSLFFKTQNGARCGDLFMSLIHTAELHDVSAFDYLVELQRHRASVAANPERWMPWNYREALADPPPDLVPKP